MDDLLTDQVIGSIYDSAISGDSNAALVESLRRQLNTHSFVLYCLNSRTRAVERLMTTAPDSLIRLHAERLHESDLWLTRGFERALNRATPTDNYVSERELLRTPFYNELLKELDVWHGMTGFVPFDGDGTFAIGVHRSATQGAFDEETRQILDQLLPHFARAERMRRRLRQAQALAAIGVASLQAMSIAAIVCQTDGKVIFANAAAEALDRACDGIRLSGGRREDRSVTAISTDVAPKLRRAIASAAAVPLRTDCGGTLLLPRPDRKPLLAVVTPLPRHASWNAPLALILISDPEKISSTFRRRVQEAFGLTPAEARLAEALVRGIGRDEFAAKVKVTQNTIKTQMRGLLTKADAKRESDLMRILLAMPRTD